MCELECNKMLLTMALAIDTDVSVPAFKQHEYILNTCRDIN